MCLEQNACTGTFQVDQNLATVSEFLSTHATLRSENANTRPSRIASPPVPIELPIAEAENLGEHVEVRVKEAVEAHEPHDVVRDLVGFEHMLEFSIEV